MLWRGPCENCCTALGGDRGDRSRGNGKDRRRRCTLGRRERNDAAGPGETRRGSQKPSHRRDPERAAGESGVGVCVRGRAQSTVSRQIRMRHGNRRDGPPFEPWGPSRSFRRCGGTGWALAEGTTPARPRFLGRHKRPCPGLRCGLPRGGGSPKPSSGHRPHRSPSRCRGSRGQDEVEPPGRSVVGGEFGVARDVLGA